MPGAEVDVVGLRGDVAHHDFGRRHVAVLGERVVLAEPGVLPVVLVGEDHVLRLAHQLLVLELGDVGRRAGDVAVEEDAELHAERSWVRGENVLMVPLRTRPVKARPGSSVGRHRRRRSGSSWCRGRRGAAVVDQPPLGGGEPPAAVGDGAGRGERRARDDRAHVVHLQVGRRERLAVVERGLHRASHHRVEQGGGDRRRAPSPSGWSCRHASRARTRRGPGCTRSSVKPSRSAIPGTGAVARLGSLGAWQLRPGAVTRPPRRRDRAVADAGTAVGVASATPPGSSRHATAAPIKRDDERDEGREPQPVDERVLRGVGEVRRSTAAERPGGLHRGAERVAGAPRGRRHPLREVAAEAGGGDAAHHRDAERATDLASGVVDGRARRRRVPPVPSP